MNHEGRPVPVPNRGNFATNNPINGLNPLQENNSENNNENPEGRIHRGETQVNNMLRYPNLFWLKL